MADKEDKLERVKSKYEDLRKRHSLPTFDEFNAEFEIAKADPDLNLAKELRRAVSHRLHAHAETFELVLSPNPNSLHSMVETKIFEKQELEPFYDLYKRLMYHTHRALLAGLQSEEDEMDFVKAVWQEWPSLKKQITRYVERLVDGWLDKSHESGDSGYVS